MKRDYTIQSIKPINTYQVGNEPIDVESNTVQVTRLFSTKSGQWCSALCKFKRSALE